MSSLTGYLGFDPTDNGSIDASASMGAFVRSGKSGALITNHNSVENPGLSFVFVDGDISANAIAETAHGLDTGDKIRLTTSGTLPSGLALLTDYYVIRVSANSFKLAASPQDAELGNAISITADGSGNHTLTSQEMAIKSLDVNVVNPISVDIALTQADEVTVYQGTSPWVIGDGGGSITVDAVNLDIRDLAFATDKVDVSGSSVSISGTVAVTQSTSPWTVDGTVELGSTTLSALENITVEVGYDYAEDSAHSSGDVGAFILAVRQDSLASSTSADGDYGALKLNQKGELYIHDTDVLAALAGNLTVIATNLDIRDLVAATDSVSSWVKDGSGNAITSSGGALDVNIQSSDITFDIDDDLCNVAIENTATAVSTSAINVVSSALANRKFLALANEGNKILYFGKNGVTTSNGFPLYMREKAMFRIGASVAPQIIGAAGSSNEDLRVMELS